MSGKLINLNDEESESGITTKSGKIKKLSELEKKDFVPRPGLGAMNQVILNAIARNKKHKEYLRKLKKQGETK